MNRFLSAAAATGLLACLVSAARGQAPDEAEPRTLPAPKAPAGAIQYVERTHKSYRQETRQRVVPTVVSKVVSREVEEKYTYTETVPVTTQQRRTETQYVTVAEEVVRQVPVCKTVAERVTDPCTGGCKTVCRIVMEMQAVRCVVSRQVPRTCAVVENVTTMQEVERVGTRRKVVQETIRETVNVTETYRVVVPFTTTVRVPVWPIPTPAYCPTPALGY